MFVGLGIDAHLGQHRLHRGRERGDQVQSGHLALATPAQGLAVEREVFKRGGLDTPLDPARQGAFDLLRVDAPERARERGLGRRLAPSEPECVGQWGSVLSPESCDPGQAFAAHEQGQRDESQNGRQGVDTTVATAWVGERGERVVQGARGHAQLRDQEATRPDYPTALKSTT